MLAQNLLSDRKISWMLSDVGIQKRANLKRQAPTNTPSSTSKKRKKEKSKKQARLSNEVKDVTEVIVEDDETRAWIVLSLHSGTLKCKDLHNALAKVSF